MKKLYTVCLLLLLILFGVSDVSFASESKALYIPQLLDNSINFEGTDLEDLHFSQFATNKSEDSVHFLFEISRAQEEAVTDKAYPSSAAKWPFNVVFVCWENLSDRDQHYGRLVQSAVENSWAKHSGLKFFGWQRCTEDTHGIRILVDDSGPHVKALGKQIDGVRNGMVLNFNFDNWGSSCRSKKEYCIRSIAVHEFGHAIGFAHEQNRPDTPGECSKLAQGPDGDQLLTPWDADSVMNYCNPKYNNDGALSEFDIIAVRYIYGSP